MNFCLRFLPAALCCACWLASCSPETPPATAPVAVILPAAPDSLATRKSGEHERLAGSYLYVVKPPTYVRVPGTRRYEHDSSTYVEAQTELNTSATAGYFSKAEFGMRAALTSWQQVKLNGRPAFLVTARYGGADRQAADPNPRELMELVVETENSIVHLDGVYRVGDAAGAEKTRRILLSAWLDEEALSAKSEQARQAMLSQLAQHPDAPPAPPSFPVD